VLSDSAKLPLVEKALIRERLLDQLIRHGFPTLIAAQCVGFLAYLVLSPFSENRFLDIWIAVFTLLTIIRYLSLIFSRRRFSRSNITWIAYFQVIGAIVGGLTWAALIFTYDPVQPLFAQLFLLLIIVGMPAASLASNAIYLPVFLAFSLPILGSMVLWTIVFTSSFQTEFTIVAMIYSVLILIIARQYAANMRNSIERGEENKILVREISRRIKSFSRESEIFDQEEAARIGGDEFIIVYHLDAGATGIEELGQRILHEISMPMDLSGKPFKPSVSIGIAIAPQHATKIKDLVRVADAAMYRRKKAGGNGVYFATGKSALF